MVVSCRRVGRRRHDQGSACQGYDTVFQLGLFVARASTEPNLLLVNTINSLRDSLVTSLQQASYPVLSFASPVQLAEHCTSTVIAATTTVSGEGP